MGKKLFWSCDRLVKHEFDCLRLGLGLIFWLGLGLWIALGLCDMFWVRVGIGAYITYYNSIRTYILCKTFLFGCKTIKTKVESHMIIFGRAN